MSDGDLVLIVEDNEKNMKLARDLLQYAGMRTLEATSAEDGIAIAVREHPDIVLMDIQLPGMDGIAALRKLREDDRTSGIPIVALTASVMQADRDRFEAAGFGRGQIARWFLEEPRPSSRNPSMPGLPRPLRASHWFFDGWSAARDQLEEAGVPAARIFVAELCTASHPDTMCSYRREGSAAGRMAGAIRSRRGPRLL